MNDSHPPKVTIANRLIAGILSIGAFFLCMFGIIFVSRLVKGTPLWIDQMTSLEGVLLVFGGAIGYGVARIIHTLFMTGPGGASLEEEQVYWEGRRPGQTVGEFNRAYLRGGIKVMIVIAIIIGGYFSIPTVQEFLAVDGCLDRGGAWDYQMKVCSDTCVAKGGSWDMDAKICTSDGENI